MILLFLNPQYVYWDVFHFQEAGKGNVRKGGILSRHHTFQWLEKEQVPFGAPWCSGPGLGLENSSEKIPTLLELVYRQGHIAVRSEINEKILKDII